MKGRPLLPGSRNMQWEWEEEEDSISLEAFHTL